MAISENVYLKPDGTYTETEPANYVFKTKKLPISDETSEAAFDGMWLGSSVSSDGDKLFTGSYATQSKIPTTSDGKGFYRTGTGTYPKIYYDTTQLDEHIAFVKSIIGLYDSSYDSFIGIEKISLKNMLLEYNITERSFTQDELSGTIYTLTGMPTLHICEHGYNIDGPTSTYSKNFTTEVFDTTPINTNTYYTSEHYPYDVSFTSHRSHIYPCTESRDQNICRSCAGGSIYNFKQDTSKSQYASTNIKELYTPYESETWVGLCANTFSVAVDSTDLAVSDFIVPIDDDNIIEFKYDGSSYSKTVKAIQQFRSLHGILLHIAKIGLPFKHNGVVYKPVTDDDNVIVDYTDDMTKTSSWDSWDKNTDIVRPTGKHGTDDDGIDDMKFDNNVAFAGGMVDYYIATAGNVEAISNGISADLTHIGIADNVVSLMAYRINPSYFAYGSMATAVNCGKLNISTGNITKINVLTPVIELGSVNVTGKHGTLQKPHFLDLSPYSKYDVYIPFCGTIELPSRIVYNTIKVYLIGDIITGSCIGVVKCNGEIVGVKSGIIGRTVPMTYESSAEQNYAMLNGVMNGFNTGTSVLLSGIAGNYAGIVSGAISGISNITQQIQASNSNYTHSIGVTGSICEGSMPEQCYLRRYSPKDLSDDKYTEVYGRPLCKNKTLSAGNGYTVVDNAVISGNMTQIERSAIIDLFRNGVIL